MSPAATVTPDAGALGNRLASLDRRLDTTTWAVCGSILPSDQSLLGSGYSVVGCLPGAFCAVSSNYVDCVPYTGGTIRTTCLDKSATCTGFACPPDAIICSIYSTVCQTWNYESSFTAYGCGTVALSINVIPLSLTSYTPTASSISTASTSINPTAPSPTSSSIPSSALQTTPSTSQLAGPKIPSAATSFSPSPSSSNLPSSLSTEAKVGIGVGASFGALLIVAILLIIIFRKVLCTRLKLSLREIPEPPNTNRKSTVWNLSTGTQQDPAELIAPLTAQISPWRPRPAPHYVSYELSDHQEVAHELPVEIITPRETRDG